MKKKESFSLLPVFLIILLPLFFFGTAFIGRDIILSGDFTGSDLLDLHYPFKVALNQTIGNFRSPLWLPDLSLGFPLLAEGQSGPFYPPNLIMAFLPPYLALNWSIILDFIIAGLGTYLYTRAIGLTRFSALVSSIILMFSAFFVTRAKHVNMITVAAWVPLIFFLTKRLFEKLSWRYALFLGIIIAFQFLAGHPQMTFFSFFIFLLYFVFEFILAGKKKSFRSIFPTAFLSLVLIIFLGLALSAVQILPTLELLEQGERLAWTLYSATSYPFHPKNLLTFISPYYFGNPAMGTYKENVQTFGVFWENASYIGILPFILALWTIWQALRRKLVNFYLLFFIGLATISLLLMLGRVTPFFGFLWNNVPGFSLFRFPTRFNLFLIFSLAILAGFGAQKLADKLEGFKFSRSEKKKEEEFQFSWPLKVWQTQALIIGVILIDLFVFAKNYLGEIRASEWLKNPPTINLFREESGLYRFWSVTQYGQSPYQLLGWKKNLEPLVAIRAALPPNVNLEYHLSSFSDRGWFEGGLSSKRRNRLEKWLLEENQDQIAMSKVLGMFNVKYVLTFAQEGGFEMTEKASYDLGKEFGLPLKIFENGQVMGRFYFVPEAKVIPDKEALLAQMADLNFLPTKTVLLEKEPRQVPLPFTGPLENFKKDNPLTLIKYEPTEVVISAQIKNHGFLVLSDLYYPGWKVKVDGKEKEILAANYMVRAVELTPGEHKIEFSYSPTSFKIGAGVSGITFFGLLIIVLSQLKIRRQKTENRKRIADYR